MFGNYLKSIGRRMMKDRQSTLLNLFGLSSGLACVLLIFLWVSDERAVDRFNEKDNRLFLVVKNTPNADKIWAWSRMEINLSRQNPNLRIRISSKCFRTGCWRGIRPRRWPIHRGY
jgi:hypothetical protein